jgi:hypothetical protein
MPNDSVCGSNSGMRWNTDRHDHDRGHGHTPGAAMKKNYAAMTTNFVGTIAID